jgi:hypothetical protein
MNTNADEILTGWVFRFQLHAKKSILLFGEYTKNLKCEAKILFILKYLLSEERLWRKDMTFAINELKEKRLG